MANNIDQEVQPMMPKLAQAGGPMLAAHDAVFAQRTQSLWYKTMGTRRSWAWPHPDAAPYVQSATLGSYVSFSIGDPAGGGVTTTFQLPWHFMPGVDGLALSVGVCVNSPEVRGSIRATIGDYAASVTNKNCPAVILPVTSERPVGMWGQSNERWRLARGILRFTGITSSNMDAQRRATLRFAINWDFREDPDDMSAKWLARMYYLHVWDVFPLPTPDDGA